MTCTHHPMVPLLCGALALGLAAGQATAAEKKAFVRATPPTPAVAAPPTAALAVPRLPAPRLPTPRLPTPPLPSAEAEEPSHPGGPDAGTYEVGHKKWAGLAARGDADAQLKLGRSYRRAPNTKANADQALHWLRAAARKNLPAAHYQLGLLYMSGAKGRDHDLVEAYARFKIASDGGDVRAAALIFYIGVRMTADELRRSHERISEIYQVETAPLPLPVLTERVQTEPGRTDPGTAETAKTANTAIAKPAAAAPAKE